MELGGAEGPGGRGARVPGKVQPLKPLEPWGGFNLLVPYIEGGTGMGARRVQVPSEKVLRSS